jgi:hypothetical protein
MQMTETLIFILMKNETLKKALMLIMGIALFAATAEAATVARQMIWTGGCFGVIGACALALNHLEKKEG